MKVKKHKVAVMSVTVKSGLIGGGMIVLIMLALSALTSLVIDKGILMTDHVPLCTWIIRAAAFFFGTLLTSIMSKEKKLQAAGIAVAVGVFLNVSATVLFWDGAFDRFLLCVVFCILAGGIGVLANMIPRNTKRSLKVRYR